MSSSEPKIIPFFWYNGKAQEAANFYVSVFKQDSYVESVTPPVVTFVLYGQKYAALDGGAAPLLDYKFTPATSLQVLCDDQSEVDHFWEALGENGGGIYNRCGWLVDRFGLSWQIVPRLLPQLLQDSNKEKAQRTMQAMLQMAKLDISALKAAHGDEEQ